MTGTKLSDLLNSLREFGPPEPLPLDISPLSFLAQERIVVDDEEEEEDAPKSLSVPETTECILKYCQSKLQQKGIPPPPPHISLLSFL